MGNHAARLILHSPRSGHSSFFIKLYLVCRPVGGAYVVLLVDDLSVQPQEDAFLLGEVDADGVVQGFEGDVFGYLRVRPVEYLQGVEHLAAAVTLSVDDDVGEGWREAEAAGGAAVGYAADLGLRLDVLVDVHLDGFHPPALLLASRVDEVHAGEELAGVLAPGHHVGDGAYQLVLELLHLAGQLVVRPLLVHGHQLVLLLLPVLLRGVDDVGGGYHVLVQVSDDVGQVIGVLQPGHGSEEARQGVHVPAEASQAVVLHGGVVPGRFPLVEGGEEAEGSAPVGVEVAQQVLRHVLQVAAVVLGPHQPALGAVQALQAAHPGPSDAPASPHDVLDEDAVHVGVLHEAGAHVSPVVPRLQPVLYLGVFHPLLRPLVVFGGHPVERGALPVEEPHLAVEDAGAEVVSLQQVADAVGQVVVLSLGHHPHACHADGVAVPVGRAEVEKLAHVRTPVHVQRELSFRRVHKRIVSDFLLDCTHMVAFLRFSRMPFRRSISRSERPYMMRDTSL